MEGGGAGARIRARAEPFRFPTPVPKRSTTFSASSASACLPASQSTRSKAATSWILHQRSRRAERECAPTDKEAVLLREMVAPPCQPHLVKPRGADLPLAAGAV